MKSRMQGGLIKQGAVALTLAVGLPGSMALAKDMLVPGNADMLKPSHVNYEGESSNPANDSGFFVGAGLGFGQVYSTEGGASPGLGLIAKLEPGYQFNRGSWNRFETSLELFSGKASYRLKDQSGGRIDMPLQFGALAKLGYGYSLGTKMTGLFKLGVGPALAQYKAKSFDASESVTGIAGMVGWDMVVPVSDSVDVVGGISLTHLQFDVGTISDANKNKFKVGSANANFTQANLGMRVRL